MRFFLIEAIAFIVAIGVLIAVHEYGHFAVARRLGFKVLRFSIGFGRPLWRHRGQDGVEYVLAVLPLGGYVKMADEREAPVASEDQPRAFNRRPVWQRIAVLLSGPGANFLFAVLAFWVLYMSGVPGLKPLVGEVQPASLAARAGMKPGDEIVAVGKEAVATQEAAVLGMLSAVVDGGRVELVVRNDSGTHPVSLAVPDGTRRSLTEPGAWVKGFGFSFPRPHLAPVVGAIAPGGTAERAGLKSGDVITSVEGRPVSEWSALVDVVRGRPGSVLKLGVRRGTSVFDVAVDVRGERDEAHPDGPPIGRIGIAAGGEPQWPPGLVVVERHGPVDALLYAARETWSKSALTVKFLGRMLTGQVSLKNVSGPLSIANYAGVSALEGGTAFLSFLALISISLGVLNLLPIPILDGGQIVYQLAEAVKGQPLSIRTQMLGQQVGIIMLILLMSLAFYNDIARHFG
jgi:regulator of sigma E protease